MKIDTMMEEPCPLYEPGWEDVTNSPADWADFWENEDAPKDWIWKGGKVELPKINKRRSTGDD